METSRSKALWYVRVRPISDSYFVSAGKAHFLRCINPSSWHPLVQVTPTNESFYPTQRLSICTLTPLPISNFPAKLSSYIYAVALVHIYKWGKPTVFLCVFLEKLHIWKCFVFYSFSITNKRQWKLYVTSAKQFWKVPMRNTYLKLCWWQRYNTMSLPSPLLSMVVRGS